MASIPPSRPRLRKSRPLTPQTPPEAIATPTEVIWTFRHRKLVEHTIVNLSMVGFGIVLFFNVYPGPMGLAMGVVLLAFTVAWMTFVFFEDCVDSPEDELASIGSYTVGAIVIAYTILCMGASVGAMLFG